MFKSKIAIFAFLAGSVALVPSVEAGTFTGGATELTQILNNIELILSGIDNATTAAATVNQYSMQIQQYRNQLVNTAGIDPGRLSSQLNTLTSSYDQLTNYRNILTRTNGSLNSQLESWQQRFSTAKLAGRTLKEQLEVEANLRAARNSTALERAKRDEQIMQEVNSDIAELRQAEADIPKSEGMNESIQNMHRSLNKIAYQNTKMIELLAEGNATARTNNMDRNISEENLNRSEQYRRDYESALRTRQYNFVNSN